MSRLGEIICLSLNSLYPKVPPYAQDGERYADAENRTISREFDWYYAKYNLDLQDKVVLDAGCGHGGKTAYYAGLGCRQITGIDMDQTHIDLAKAYSAEKGLTNTTFQIELLEDLSFDSNTFDVIFFNGTMEHIRREIMVPVLTELKRVLKPSGRLFVDFPPWSAPYAAHLHSIIYIPWCQYLFSDSTLIAVTNKLGPPERAGALSFVEHYLELNRCTIAEFKRMIADVGYDVVDFELIPLRKKKFLLDIPLFYKLFVVSIHAVLSKTHPDSPKTEVQTPLGDAAVG